MGGAKMSCGGILQAAAAKHSSGSSAAAERKYQRAISLGCGDVAFYNLGLLQHHQQRLAEAEVSYRLALLVSPGHRRALGNLGALQQQQHRYPEAIERLRLTISLAPTEYNTYLNLGHAFFSRTSTTVR